MGWRRSRHLAGFDDAVLSLYAKGMTTGDITAHLADIYGTQVSRNLVSRVTDAVLDDMADWRTHPLNSVYPVVLIDAIYVKIREGHVANRPIHVAMGIDMDGYRDVLGMWAGPAGGSEGAKQWMSMLTDLKNRGVGDVCIVCCDGLQGLPRAFKVSPRATLQTRSGLVACRSDDGVRGGSVIARVKSFRSGLTVVMTAALVFGLLLVGRASAPVDAAQAASSVAPATVAKVKGRQLRIKVRGKRYGKRATVTLRGYRGAAKGTKRTVKVKKTKIVKRLKPGKYKVIARRITRNGAVAKAKRINPKRVRVTRTRRARTKITYRQIKMPTPKPIPVPVPKPTTTQRVLAAGDIAQCGNPGHEKTAALLGKEPGAAILILGDNAYVDGTLEDFTNCFDPTWGQFKDRIFPAPGNHEYRTEGAAGYFDYFGTAAGDPAKGYYSFDIGSWHILSLNSACSEIGGCNDGSPQHEWLEADLKASQAQCTLSYVHYPRFSSGTHGDEEGVQDIWATLANSGSEIMLAGHDHGYERFAPMNADGQADPNGTRLFVVGTGGMGLRGKTTPPRENSQAQNNSSHGVLGLDLAEDGYEWDFLPVAGKTYADKGAGACH